MTVLSQQIPQWFPGAGNPLEVLKKWEGECTGRRNAWKKEPSTDALDWICLAFDTPFFGLTPNYLGEIESESMRSRAAAMHYIYEAMQYVRHTGGVESELFLVKPHELYRFVKLAERQGLIKPEKT
jgi:hypothetical protein